MGYRKSKEEILYLVVDENKQPPEKEDKLVTTSVFAHIKELEGVIAYDLRKTAKGDFLECWRNNLNLEIHRADRLDVLVIDDPRLISNYRMMNTYDWRLEVIKELIVGGVVRDDIKVISLERMVKFCIRKLLIKDYFRTFIAEKISPEVEKIYERISGAMEHISFAYGLISGYKPEVLVENLDRPLYWTKMLRNSHSEDFLSSTDSVGRCIISKSNAAVQTFDIFSHDQALHHLSRLALPSDTLAFSVDLTSLREILVALDLMMTYKDNLR